MDKRSSTNDLMTVFVAVLLGALWISPHPAGAQEANMPDEILVKFKPNVGKAEIDALNSLYGVSLIEHIEGIDVYRLRISSGSTLAEMLDLYRTHPNCEYAVPNSIGRGGDYFPDDTYFPQQWHLDNVGQTGGEFDADIDATEGWQIARGSGSIVVAVLDTGIDSNHREFQGRILPGFDFVNDDDDPEADHPHGVWVSGIIAANTANTFSVAGIDHNVAILPVKVLDALNLGSTSDLVQGLILAANRGAHVINMSLINFPTASPVLNDALKFARDAGSILIACAGNGGIGNADLSGPGASPLTISVGATDDTDARAAFSATGSALDVVAPGVDLRTTRFDSDQDVDSSFSGCSAATPVVSGIATLLLSANPALTHDEVRNLLIRSAEDLVGPAAEDTLGRDDFFGHGRVNMNEALTLLEDSSSAESIDFEGIAPGTVLSSVSGDLGSGPIPVTGVNPERNFNNAAVVFDSANPTGDDIDLGTPNQDCGGLGNGTEVGPETPFENCMPLGNVLVVAASLVDLDEDGLVDDPNDIDSDALDGVTLSFDFASLGSVTVESMTVLDIDGNGPDPRVDLADSDDNVIISVPLPTTPNNGRAQVDLGPTPGVAKMIVHLQGSGAIDNVRFDSPKPCVGIEKLISVDAGVSFASADADSDVPIVPFPADALYRLIVANCGSVALIDVVVTDPMLDISGFLVGELAAGAEVTLTEDDISTLEASPRCDVGGEFINVASVSARSAAAPDNQIADSDAAVLICQNVPGSLGDRVWNDINGNGVPNEGEPGIEGVTLTLFDSEGNEVGDPTMTDDDGGYRFFELAPGTYTVKLNPMTLPEGATPTFDSDGIDTPHRSTTALAAGERLTKEDFGYELSAEALGSLGDRVWSDVNGNGKPNEGEPGIEGVTLTLFDNEGIEIDRVTTDEDGGYRFFELAAGTYRVKVDPTTLPEGAIPTFDRDGIDTPHTSRTRLEAGARFTKQDFGYKLGQGEGAGDRQIEVDDRLLASQGGSETRRIGNNVVCVRTSSGRRDAIAAGLARVG